jgi:4-hydroxybenzoate polyprenyltransferase
VLSTRPHTYRIWLRALRVQHWTKNLLLFVPVLAAHEASLSLMLRLTWAFLMFCICASGGYLVNDLLDLESDRVHPTKRERPLAAGILPIAHALTSIPLLFAAAFTISLLTLPPPFLGMLAVYSAFSVYYSVHLKTVAIVDVLVLSGLYTLRLLAGAMAVTVPVSEWLLAFSLFLFLSLAFMKRYSEIAALRERNIERARGRDYAASDLELVRAVGPASGYLAVLVLALYITSDKVVTLYRTPALLWLAVPLLLYWVTRMWFVASRNRMLSDPVVFALKDRISYVLAGMVILFVFLAI